MKLLISFIKLLIVLFMVMIEFAMFLFVAFLVLFFETLEDVVKYFKSK